MEHVGARSPQTAAELDAAFAVGRAAWPAIEPSRDAFVAFVRHHSIVASVPAEILQDLFFACACGTGNATALQCFRERFFNVVSHAVRSLDASPQFAEEIYQRLSETLFVRVEGHDAKITRYRGDGPLAGFVRISARRIGLRVHLANARFQGEDGLVQQFSQASDLEATILKLQCRETINQAVRIALRQLPRRERLILRMNVVERISTTRIAAMYKVTQPTVSRWIQRSARTIHETVKELVCDELEIDTADLESLLLLVRSQIDITISQGSALGSTPSL